MSSLAYIRQYAMPLALELLPPEMNSPEASAELLAIGWQESRYETRFQIGGPARSWFQFELGGVNAAIGPAANRAAFNAAAARLGYPTPMPANAIFSAIAHHDVLACVLARLLLWNLPDPLPTREQRDLGWTQYVSAWRPGKPKPATWPFAWAIGWNTNDGGNQT